MSKQNDTKATIESHIEWHDKIETDKMLVHIACILVGCGITALLSFIPAVWAIHFVGIVAGVPSITQEFIDRIIRGF